MASEPTDFSFGKSRRLLNAAEYGAVFDRADWKVSSKEILCLARDNGFNHPRLGLVIAKKNIKHAVQRNRLKRIIRESFRLHQHDLGSADMVILIRRGTDTLSNEALHAELANLWQRLIKRMTHSASAATDKAQTQ